MSLRILSIPWSEGVAAPMAANSLPPFPYDFFVSTTGSTGAGTIGDPWSLAYAWGSGAGSAQGDGKLPSSGANIGIRGGTYSHTNTNWILRPSGTLDSGEDNWNPQ